MNQSNPNSEEAERRTEFSPSDAREELRYVHRHLDLDLDLDLRRPVVDFVSFGFLSGVTVSISLGMD
eukprot:scaffold80719_cov35-Attheya_sp.AAC.1